LLLAALASCALAGCATPEKISLNDEAAKGLDTVTIIVPPEPRKYTVLNMAHPGMMFGAVGGIIAAADQANKEDKFAKAAQTAEFSVTRALATRAEQKLRAAGYKVTVQELAWELNDGKYTLKPESIPGELGTVLIITPSVVGYDATLSDKQHYQPTIHVAAILLDSDRKTTLYKGFHSTGWKPNGDAWRHTVVPTTFSDFDALRKEPKASAAALHLSAEAICTSIAQDLKRP
jgi:hypothetical protein